MSWSIVHEQQYNQTTAVAPNATNLAPWVYYFETFLPSKGWTVTADEQAGMVSGDYNLGVANSKFYGVQKTDTDALGNTHDRGWIIAINFSYRYVSYWEWDGTAGGGVADFANRYDQANNFMIGSDYYWRFMESDQDSDLWMVLLGDTSIGAFHFPTSQTFLAAPTIHNFPSLTSWDLKWRWQNSLDNIHGKIGGSAFEQECYLITPNFAWGHTNDTNTQALNSTNDLLMKFNGTKTANAQMNALGCASFEINGTYYLDLYPTALVSFVLETGTTDFGLF